MRWLSLLLVVIVFGSSLANSSTDKICLKDNPFRRLYREQGVKNLDTPSFNTGYCQSEWQIHGTCCEVDSALAYVENDRKAIERSRDLFIAEMEDFGPKFIHFWNNLKHAAALDPSFWEVVPESQRPMRVFNRLIELPQLIRMSEKLISRYLESASTYSADMKECWDFMSKIRGASICDACSSRGSGFFQSGKAFAGSSACDPVIEHCYEPMKTTIGLLRIWAGLDLNQKLFTQANIVHNVQAKVDDMVKAYRAFNKDLVASNILSDIRMYKQQVNVPGLNKNQFCAKFVTLAESPFIVELLKNIVPDLKWKLEFSKQVTDILAAAPASAKELERVEGIIHKVIEEIKAADRKQSMQEKQQSRMLHAWNNYEVGKSHSKTMGEFTSDTLWCTLEDLIKRDEEISVTHSASGSYLRVLNLSLSFP